MKKVRNNSGTMILSILIMFSIILSSCAGKTEKKDTTTPEIRSDTTVTLSDSTASTSDPGTTAASGSDETPEDPLVYQFEEQVIYDKDGLKLTARPAEHYSNRPTSKVIGIEVETENKTDKDMGVKAVGIILPDGLIISFTQSSYRIYKNKSYPIELQYMNDVSFSGLGSFTNYKTYGMGDKIGDFRLLYVITDPDTEELIREFETDVIKTSKPGNTAVKSKSPVFDQNGVKLYMIDNVIVNSNTSTKELDEMYKTIFYYENSTDSDFEIEYLYPVVNSKEMNTTQLGKRFVIYKKRNGFTYADVRLQGLSVKGIKNLDSLKVNISLKDLTHKDVPVFESDPVTLEYPDPWKKLDSEKKE